MKKLLLIFFLLIGSLSYGQTTFTQTFVDRCTGEVKVVTANFVNGSATVAFYNRVRTFTYQEFTSGVLQGWLIETYTWWTNLSPCSNTQTQATTAQQQAQQAQQQATQASTAATNATSNATNAASTATNATNTTATTGTTQTTTTGTSGGTTTTNTGSTNTGSTNTSSSNTSTGGTTNDNTTNTNNTSNDSGTTNSGTENSGGGTETGSTESGSSSDSNSGETSDTSSEGSSEGSSSEESSGEVENKEETKTEESSEEKKEETKEETKEEEKKEESSEEKEEEKKEEESEESDEESEEESEEESTEEESEEESDEEEEKKFMPIQLKADMMSMQTPLGSYNAVLNIGASRSSIYGDVSYTANMMVWDNLQQVSFMGARSKVKIVTPDYSSITHENHKHYGKGKEVNSNDPQTPPQPYVAYVSATSLGYSNNYGYSTMMLSQSLMKPFTNGLTVGVGFSAGTTFVSYPIKEGFMLSYNALATKSFQIGNRITYSPALIWTQTPFMSGESGVNFKWENPMGLQMKNMLKGKEIDGMAIMANSFTVQLTNRFSFNVGWTLIKSTNPIIPTMNSFMIGSKLPF